MVPTPVGNLEDITLRAIKILEQTDIILAEDTRHTGLLLKYLGIKKKMWSYHTLNEHRITDQIVAKLQTGTKIALVSDAGTPSISDPGFLLVKSCIKADLRVECLPGATAFVPALVQSGFPTERFIFEGFLPHKKKRKKRIENLTCEECTIVLYESPHRLIKTLTQLCEILGKERKAVVCRELSKKFEENLRGTLAELQNHFQQQEPRGEFVLLVEGKNDN